MVWAAVIAAGVSLIQANKNNKAAQGAANASSKLSKEALQFSKDQYNEWKAIYGPIERNLGDFYNNLSPDFFATRGLETQQAEFQASNERLTEYFAQNEISSGVQTELFAQGELENARTRAKIRADAPSKTAEAKQGFLALGLNQKSAAVNSVVNATNNQAGLLSNQATQFANNAKDNFATAGSLVNTAIDSLENNANSDEKTTANQGTPTRPGDRLP